MKIPGLHISATGAMADSKFIPEGGHNPAWVLEREKRLLVKHYDFLELKIAGGTLKCTGWCRPSDLSVKYVYRLSYRPGRPPSVHPIDPVIGYHDDIHMYKKDNSLCLYYPGDESWTEHSSLFNTIIPWTHEWFLFYELYKMYRKWLHPAVSHGGKGQ